jgi:hypothetical protein
LAGGGDDAVADSRSGRLVIRIPAEERVPEGHLLRRINAVIAKILDDLHKSFAPY